MPTKFINDESRKIFFRSLKEKTGLVVELRNRFSIPKSSFERYQSGKSLIPDELFFKLLKILDKSERKIFITNITKLPKNWGQVIGGKKAYILNYKQFEYGRKKGIISLKKRAHAKEIYDFNFNLSKDLCEFIGAFIGDGFFNSYKNKLYQIEFAGDSRYDMEYYSARIIPIIKNYIPDLNPHIYKVKNKNAMRAVFYSKKLFYFLKDYLKFTPGKKTHSVIIPDYIMNSDSIMINSTIRGVFDTDGSIFFDKRKRYKNPYPRITFSTVSENLYLQLLNYLSKHFNIYSRYDKNRKSYCLEIYGTRQFEKWMSLIGFSNQKHLKKIAPVA